jgi:phosphate starvation-inducible protein PhoH and related proteins
MQETIQLQTADEERALLGRQDRTLRLLRDALGIRILARKGLVVLEGDATAVREGVRLVSDLLAKVREKGDLAEDEVEQFLYEQRGGRDGRPGARRPDGQVGFAAAAGGERVAKTLDESPVRPRTPGQQRYVEMVLKHDVVFATGPAGTGKTYLAVALAVRMMRQGLFRKLVLVRPAVEAGEKLGFLPGDLQAKVSPYLRPLYDAIGDFVEFGEIKRYVERDIIEVAPLAYMRGRTLDNAFIILDEGQNTTRAQMQMFLTRMGRRSKIVVTGDTTQIDLPRGVVSGLVDAVRRLRGIDGIGITEMQRGDIVRHPLVQKIVEAYAGEGSGTQPGVPPLAEVPAAAAEGTARGEDAA